jgi:hypothetical protein
MDAFGAEGDEDMRAKLAVDRLSEEMKRVILRDPMLKKRAFSAEELPSILTDAEWAAAWTRESADPAQRAVLRSIVSRYAGLPFEADRLVKQSEEQFGLTGAETRVALAKLRRSGILFAVRKAWGDRILFLPVDAIAVWQPLVHPADNLPLQRDEAAAVERLAKIAPMALTLELLQAWHEIARQPVEFTTKGAPHRASVARVVAASGLASLRLTDLELRFPYAEQVPLPAAFIFDLGLSCGVLQLDGSGIRIRRPGLARWLSQPLGAAERSLRELVIERYCSADASFHLTAAAIFNLEEERWYTEGRLADWQSFEQKEARLGFLEALGWIERGRWKGRDVIRRKAVASLGSAPAPLILQPDGEILVPPEAGLNTRWTLQDVAEKRVADLFFVYRITSASCEKAYKAGYSLDGVAGFLKQASGEPLPALMAALLRDGFGRLGRTRLTPATLLRTESAKLADELMGNPELSPMLLERIGERDFLVDAASAKLLRAKLSRYGYPPEEHEENASLHGEGETFESEESGVAAKAGWIERRHDVSLFESDRTLQEIDDLFPGLGDIPAAWITKERSYHPSTSREMLQRAIAWQTAVQVAIEGETRLFVPKSIREEDSGWSVAGSWQLADASGNGAFVLQEARMQADEVASLRIVVPDLEPLETD